MQFKPFEPGIDVHGRSLQAIIAAFETYPSLVQNILLKYGIGTRGPDKRVVIDTEKWYPQDAWLAAFEAIATAVGPFSLFGIGQHVPKHAQFPPSITDINSALESIDIAYHMNHRKKGRVMFDPRTGAKMEGIGHYDCRPVPGETKIVCVCENPYPCDFDRGVITAMANRFQVRANTTHDDTQPCRKKGGRSCTYVVKW